MILGNSTRARFTRLATAVALSATVITFGQVTTPTRLKLAAGASPSGGRATRMSPSHIGADIARLPLAFEPNRGQTASQVKFLAHGPDFTLFLTGPDAVFSVSHGLGKRAVVARNGLRLPSTPRKESIASLRFLGANPRPSMVGLDRLPGRVSYFVGKKAARWHTGIPTFARVLVRNLYPGIDAVYYSRDGRLEYDLVVHPHADLNVLRFRIDGAGQPRLGPSGDLRLRDGLRLGKPSIHQESSHGRSPVAGTYVVARNGQVRFDLGKWDRNGSLVIDPTMGLLYSTYLGGSGGGETAYGISVDPSTGDAYVTGTTSSSDFPTCPGSTRAPGADPCAPATGTPLQSALGGPHVAFVAELNPAGTQLTQSTYLGGSRGDDGLSIALDDSTGDVYVSGDTISTDFPTCPGSTRAAGADACTSGSGAALQSTQGGGGYADGFVAELNADGTKLIYSTYLGGGGFDYAYGIAVDPLTGDAYVTGYTGSGNFPTCPGSTRAAGADPCALASGTPLQSSDATSGDAFVAELNASGTDLTYSTYLGGGNYDAAYAIAEDPSTGDAYVTGYTGSSNFPSCPGSKRAAGSDPCTSATGTPLQSAVGYYDAFVAELNAGGTELIYSTYLGGSGADEGYGIAEDPSTGDAYVTGYTYSTDFPTCPGSARVAGADPCTSATGTPLQSASGGGGSQDAFVAKLNPDGTELIYSTYLGGAGDDFAQAIAVDLSTGDAYVTGYTDYTGFPTCPGSARAAGSDPCDSGSGTPLQSTYAGGSRDAFVAELNADGTDLVYSSYLGGSREDFAQGIALDPAGDAFVTGETLSTDFPTCPGGARAEGDDPCAFTSGVPLQSANNGSVVGTGFVSKIGAFNPSAERVTRFSVRPHGRVVTFRWRVSEPSGIAGFNLYAGTRRLNPHIISAHAGRSYKFTTRHPGRGPFSLHVILDDGHEIVVR